MADNSTKIVLTAEDKTRAALDSATNGLKQLEAAASRIPTLGTAIAGALSVGTFTAGIGGAIKFAAALDDMAEKTGASVETLSGLAQVAKIGGRDLGEVEQGLVRLAKGLAGADEEARGAGHALQALGLNAEELRKLDTGEALQKIAMSMAQFKDSGGKAALAMDLFGKSGAQLLPYLKDLAEWGDLNVKVTADQAAAAEHFEKNLKRLQSSAGGLSRTMATELLPTLVDVSDKLVAAFKPGLATGFVNSWAAAFKGLAAAVNEGMASVEEALARVTFGKVAENHIKQALQYRDAAKRIYQELSAQAQPERTAPTRPTGDLSGYKSREPKALKERGKTLEDLLNEGAGVNKDFADNLGTLRAGYDSGRIGLDQFREAVEKLISKQPFAIELHRQEKQALEDMERVLKKVADVQRQVADERDKFSLEGKQQVDDLAFEKSQLGKSASQKELAAKIRAEEKRAEKLIEDIQRKMGEAGMGGTEDYDREIAKTIELSEAIKKNIVGAYEEVNEARMSWVTGMEEGVQSYLDSINNLAAQTSGLITGAFRSMEDAIVEFATTGKFNFKKFADSVVEDLIRIQVRQSIIKPIAESMKESGGLGGLIKSFFGGGKAVGGAVDPSRYYLVGEQGPELFVPSSAGTIVPNEGFGGGGGGNVSVVQNISIDSRSDRATILSAMSAAKEQAKLEIMDSMRRGGAFARA